MKTMRVIIIVWVSGVVAGIVLMERWRRHGGRYVPVEPAPPEFSSTIDTSTVPAGQPNVVKLVVTGAKLDAERLRQRWHGKSSSKSAPASATSSSQ